MTFALTYATGTISVANGSTAVTGSGVTWTAIREGDSLIDPATGARGIIASIEDTSGALTLLDPWPGTSLTDDAYRIVYDSPARRSGVVVSAAIEELVAAQTILLARRADYLVQDALLDTPPGSPTAGDVYLVGTSPSGAWSGKAGYLATWTSAAAWAFTAPETGMRVVDLSVDPPAFYFRGASAWSMIDQRVLFPEMYSLTATPTATHVQQALDAALALSKPITFPGKSYTLTAPIIFRAGTKVIGNMTFALNATGLTSDQVNITFEDNCTVDGDIVITTPGTETNSHFLKAGKNFRVRKISAVAASQRAGGGMQMQGDGLNIELIETENIDRPIIIGGVTNELTQTSYIGGLICKSYVRGIRYIYHSGGTLGFMRAWGQSPNAAYTPGHNGILLSGARNMQFGDIEIADSGEHAVRIGGAENDFGIITGWDSRALKFGIIKASRTGGCAFKANPAGAVNEVTSDISIGSIFGLDIGRGVNGGNREFLRISHVRGMAIGTAVVRASDYEESCQRVLSMNDVDGLTIDYLEGRAPYGVFTCDEGQDSETDNSTGPVQNIRIGRYVGDVGSATRFFSIKMSTYGAGNIYIGDMDVSSASSTILDMWSTPISGPITIKGRWPATGINVDGANLTVQGPYVSLALQGPRATLENMGPTFSPLNVPGGFGALMLNARFSTSGIGLYGSGLSFTRPGTNRRGAAIAVKQNTANQSQCGLDFFVGNPGSVSSEQVNIALSLLYNRRMLMPSLEVYADNTAALAAGHAEGTVYWTPAGELRVVVAEGA